MKFYFPSIGVLLLSLIYATPTTSQAITLGEVLDNANLTWTTSVGVTTRWVAETTNSIAGGSAAVCGSSIAPGLGSALSTTLTGPGTLTYSWAKATTCAPTAYPLYLLLDGNVAQANDYCVPQYSLWFTNSYAVPSGTHTITWAITNFGATTIGGVAFLDQVVWLQTASITLSNLSQIYDGAAKMVSALITPSGLSALITYNGSANAPTNAGTYTVVGTITNAGYQGVVTNTLTVAKAAAIPYFNDVNLVQLYDGTAKFATVTTVPPGIQNTITYNGSLNAPTNIGNYTVVATITNPNWQGSTTNTLKIGSKPLFLSSPQQVTTWRGGIAKFSFTADGTGPFFYYLKNGASVISTLANSLQTNIILSATNVQPSGLGTNYSLTINNSWGTAVASNIPLSFVDVAAWGRDNFGQVDVPPGMTNVITVVAGQYYQAGLCLDGRIYVWGLGTFDKTNVPTDLTNAISIAAGNAHIIALRKNGTVTCWGLNGDGQTNVPTGLSNIVSIAGGFHFSAALSADGKVAVWGNSALTNVPANLSNVVAIAAGSMATAMVALKSDGSVVAWGDNTWGQTNVPPDLTNAIAVSAGNIFNMSLTADGRVRVWGDTGNFYNVTNVPVNMTNVLAVSAGDEQCLALQADGKVIAWGYDAGYGATTLPPGLVSASSVSAGFDHNIAVVANGNAIPTSKGLMQNAALDSGLFSALLPSQSGHVYALQYRKSLDDTNWFSLPLVPGNGTNQILIDTGATNDQRYYRVIRW